MREGLFDHHRLDYLAALATSPGGGAQAQLVLGPVPEGYAWYVEGIGFAVIGNSHTAAVDCAITPDNGALPAMASWDHYGLVWKFDSGTAIAAIAGTARFEPALYVPSGHFVHLYATGGTLAAGDGFTGTFQTAVHQLDPHFLMSPDDTAQVKAAHERMAAELNMDAVGRRAN